MDQLQNTAHIHIKDSRKLESFITSESVDLIITGPPYWNELIYSEDPGQLSRNQNYSEFLTNIGEVWQSCARVLKPGAILAFWCHDLYRYHDNSLRYLALHSDLARQLPAELEVRTLYIWDRYLHRLRPMPQQSPIGSRLQYIVIAQKKGAHTNDPLINTSLAHYYWQPVWYQKTQPLLFGSSLLFRLAFHLNAFVAASLTRFRSLLPSNAISDKHLFKHYLSECPPEIAEKLIRDFSNKNDVVLDPFVGSGTTLKAALDLERQAIGIDINQEIVKVLADKLKGYSYTLVD